MKTASCKAKARVLQNLVTEIIRKLFHLSTADVKPAIMGESGIDIKLSDKARSLLPYGIECKNVEKLNVYEAWSQAVDNSKKEELIPMLIIKRNQKKPLMILDLEHGFSLIRELQLLKGNLKED